MYINCYWFDKLKKKNIYKLLLISNSAQFILKIFWNTLQWVKKETCI